MLKTTKVVIGIFGILFLLMFFLSFTDQPFWAYHYLGTANSAIESDPDYIVVMGAGAMPGGAGMMRCLYASKAAKVYPEAKIIVAMPAIPGEFIGSEPYKMYEEIQRNNIEAGRFLFETTGTNSYSQACGVYRILKNKSQKNLLIVTSPEHMYRCILTFEKCGFENVDGLSSFSAAIDNNLLITEKEKASKRVPLVRNISLRYNMWNYLKLEIDVLREVVALSYYKIKGYI